MRWIFFFTKPNALPPLGESSPLPPPPPKSLSFKSEKKKKPPHPAAGDLRMPLIASNQSLNEALTHCTRISNRHPTPAMVRTTACGPPRQVSTSTAGRLRPGQYVSYRFPHSEGVNPFPRGSVVR